MSRFNQALLAADARLSVPEPARSRILLEIAADMEDLYEEYLGRGTSEAEAEAAVMDHFDLSDEALRELVRVHDTPLQRSLEKVSGNVRGPWSQLLMAVLALLVTVGSGNLLFRMRLYGDASNLVWIVVPILILGLILAGGKTRSLYRAGPTWSPSLGHGLSRLLGLAVVILVVTGAGLWVELYLSALRIRSAPAETMIHLLGWLYMASATLVVALSSALVLGFLWFFLQARVRQHELSAAATLLEVAR
jgi:hypothetical protein